MSFNGTYIVLTQKYRTYFHFDKFDETYELIPPVCSIHNILPLMGSQYNDIGEKMIVKSL